MKLVILSLLWAVSMHLAANQSQTVVDVLSVEYPPFIGEQEEEHGLCFRLLRSYAKENSLNLSFNPVFMPPARAETLLADGHYCLSFYPPANTPNEFEFIVLSEQKVRLGLIRPRQAKPFVWQKLSELAGSRVALLRANKGGPMLGEIRKAGMEVVYVEDIVQGLRMLDYGLVEYAFGDNTTLNYMAKAANLKANSFQFSDSSLFETIIGIHLRKSCRDKVFAIRN